MKSKLMLLAVILAAFTTHAISQSVIAKEAQFNLKAGDFLDNATNKPYNFDSEDGYLKFLNEKIFVKTEITGDTALRNLVNADLTKSAIIVLRHDLDAKALNGTTLPANFDSMQEALEDLMDEEKAAIIKTSVSKQLSANDVETILSVLSKAKSKDIKTLTNNKADFANNEKATIYLNSLLTSLYEDTRAKYLQNEKVQNAANPAILEGSSNINKLLHKEGAKFSQYLLETREIYLVIIGGQEDLQKATIKIQHNKNALLTSFEGLKEVIAKVLKAGPVTEIPCRVIKIKADQIIPPSDLIIQATAFKEDLKYVIHEKAYAQFKVGVSFNQLDKKYFNLKNNELSVTLDSAGKSEWKANLIATLDFYPFGRDIDRLDAFWKKDGIPFQQRLGLYAGLRIATDPLKGIYYGVSFAAAKNITLNIGAASLLNEKEQTINVGDLQSLSDAKQLLKRQYSTQFFIGLTFAPSDLKRIIWGDDKQ